jgi:hypothetical protein
MQNTEPVATPSLEITTSRQFLSWLAEQNLSIALTTYQIGKLFLLGLKPNGELSMQELRRIHAASDHEAFYAGIH